MTYPIELVSISKSFPSADGKGNILILNDISLRLESGKSTAVMGKSGTGKSTLLNICGGFVTPTGGSVLVNGNDLSKLNDDRISQIRNKSIAYVYQSFFLFEDFTALENVMVPALIAGQSRHQCTDKAMNLLRELGLEDRFNHYPGQMSGGEKQRLSIARALMNDPQVILADEPTGSLDEENAKEVEDRLLSITSSGNRTLLLVTHNSDFAGRCDNIYVLKNHTLTKEKGN